MEKFNDIRFRKSLRILVVVLLNGGIAMECYGRPLALQISYDSLFLNGNTALRKGIFLESDALFSQGYKSAKANNDSLWMGRFLNGKGSVKLGQKDTQEAIKRYLEGLTYCLEFTPYYIEVDHRIKKHHLPTDVVRNGAITFQTDKYYARDIRQ